MLDSATEPNPPLNPQQSGNSAQTTKSVDAAVFILPSLSLHSFSSPLSPPLSHPHPTKRESQSKADQRKRTTKLPIRFFFVFFNANFKIFHFLCWHEEPIPFEVEKPFRICCCGTFIVKGRMREYTKYLLLFSSTRQCFVTESILDMSLNTSLEGNE